MLLNLKKIAATTALGLFAVLGTSELANAQGKSGKNQERKIDKQQMKADRQQAKIQRQREALQRQRQEAWARRNGQLEIVKSGNDRSNGMGYYNGNANANTNRDGRYRVYRNGSYYNTNQRGADLLRQAVNQGYQQGFQAGRNDRNSDRNMSWSNSRVYQTGTYGYQSAVSQSQYRYYFQQGFQRGYQDGSNSQYQNDYNGDYQYGSYNNGSPSILETILNTILRIQNY